METKRVIRQRLERPRRFAALKGPGRAQPVQKGHPATAVKAVPERPVKAVRPVATTTAPLLTTSLCVPLPASEFPTPDWFRKDEPVEVTVIIPLFKSASVVRDLIRSWPPHEVTSCEILFIDDCCPNDSKTAVLREWQRCHPDERAGRILVSPENQGYGQACNAAARYARGSILIFLNADTTLTPGWLPPLVRAFDGEGVGIVGNLQLKDGGLFDGTIDSAGSEWRWDVQEFSHLGRHSFRHQNLVQPMLPAAAPRELIVPGDRDMVTGCCFGIKAGLFRYIGGFDANYRIGYWEDSEINMRVKELGYRIVFEPASVIRHKLGHSGASGHSHMRTNRELFLNKWVVTGRIDPLVNRPRPAPRAAVRSVLVKRTGARGDVLVAASVLPALKKAHPGCLITFCTNCPELLSQNPHADLVISDHEVAERLATVYYNLDLCYEFRPECNILTVFAEHVGVKPSDCHPFIRVEPLPETLPDRYVVFHSGRSNWAGRNWTEERWAEVTSVLRERGETVVVVGNPDDTGPPCDLDLRGRTNVWQLADVIRRSRLFVGTDSFPMHVAQAMNTPGVVFFGSIRPDLRLYRANMQAVVADGLGCLGCHHRKAVPCVFTGECETGTLDCINRVKVAHVLDRIALALGT